MNHSLRARSAHDVGEGWTAADATELYEIARWGQGYFAIGDNGQVKIHPTKEQNRAIDLKQLVDDLERRGITLPTLIRFSDVLKHRLRDIFDAFQRAMAQGARHASHGRRLGRKKIGNRVAVRARTVLRSRKKSVSCFS